MSDSQETTTTPAGLDTTQGPVQTRDTDGALLYFYTLDAALMHALDNPSVWKISFDSPVGRIRLTRSQFQDNPPFWVYDPISIKELYRDPNI